MFFTYTEENTFKVNNQPINNTPIDNQFISDELKVKPGDSLEVTEYAKSHRNRIKLSDLLSEDFTLILTGGVAAIVGFAAITGFSVTPSVTAFKTYYVENRVEVSFQLGNITGGNTILSITNEEEKTQLYVIDGLTNGYYKYVFEIPYNITCLGEIKNVDGGTVKNVHTFTLLVESEA